MVAFASTEIAPWVATDNLWFRGLDNEGAPPPAAIVQMTRGACAINVASEDCGAEQGVLPRPDLYDESHLFEMVRDNGQPSL